MPSPYLDRPLRTYDEVLAAAGPTSRDAVGAYYARVMPAWWHERAKTMRAEHYEFVNMLVGGDRHNVKRCAVALAYGATLDQLRIRT